MVTTAASRQYTPLALRSFFAHTPLADDDCFFLIDNDGDFTLPADVPAARITVVRPATPQGCARNGNLLLAEARARGADLFVLNNDLVFTSGWLEPLLADRRALLSPVSKDLARERRASAGGYRVTQAIPFFCIKIPRAVYEAVGNFDERFGQSGGEDRDYAARAWLAGIPLEYALQSYVFHFQGTSGRQGAETPAERAQRNARYTEAFRKKWGAALTYAFLGEDWNLFRTDPRLARLLDEGNYAALVKRLRARPALDTFMARQRQARFAAVCCLYDDDSWLAAAVESVYDACDSLWFLVGERPWHGAAIDPTALIERVRALPDPARKIRVLRGDWPNEATQRNAGLEIVREAGADYCFVLDADEIYEPRQLHQAMRLARENPQIDCWRASCLTYWKSYRYRIDPPEAITAAIFVRTGTGRFVEHRTYAADRQIDLPPETLVFHHMSYARTNEQIRRKLSTFADAHQVVPGWYENVWRRWDVDRRVENLNPRWPAVYRRAVEQPYEALPSALRRVWNEDEANRRSA